MGCDFMKNKMGNSWFIIGIIPYIITLIFSIISIFTGVSTCFLNSDYYFCDVVTGLSGFGQVWYMLLYIFFPVYLICFLFIILGLFKNNKASITHTRMLLLFGAAPFILSLICFLCGCLADTMSSIYILFSDIFVRHFFIVFADFMGIVFILIGLHRLKQVENKKTRKD